MAKTNNLKIENKSTCNTKPWYLTSEKYLVEYPLFAAQRLSMESTKSLLEMSYFLLLIVDFTLIPIWFRNLKTLNKDGIYQVTKSYI